MELAEAVLTLAYELEHPQTLLRAYQAKGDTLDENYVSMDQIWSRVTFSSGSGDFVNYTINGEQYKLSLSQLSKEIYFDDQISPKKITFVFTNDDIALNKTITVANNTYPIAITWTLTPLKVQITNASLYLTTNFDLKYHFEEVEIPGLLNWVNPWDAPDSVRSSNGTIWAVASFSAAHLKDKYIGLYDGGSEVGFAYRFADLPDWGNIGVLGNKQIDAVRLVFNFDKVDPGETAVRSFEMLSLSKSSYSALSREGLRVLFTDRSAQFLVFSRDFSYYIREQNIGFIVYDRNQLDTQIIHSKILQLIYSNDRYVIFKILT
jgi:hypothetical protein